MGVGGPAPASSTVPSCALSITPDFDPELQSRLAGRGLRTGHPRIRSLPLGDRTLHPQQLPHFSRSLAHQVSGGVLILGGGGGQENSCSPRVSGEGSTLEPEAGDSLVVGPGPRVSAFAFLSLYFLIWKMGS